MPPERLFCVYKTLSGVNWHINWPERYAEQIGRVTACVGPGVIVNRVFL